MKPKIAHIITMYFSVELLKTYDVFSNYYTGEPVFFYRLVTLPPKTSPG